MYRSLHLPYLLRFLKMMILFSVILFFYFFLPTNSYAHAGGGPPFVKVNGTYCPNDPYFQNISLINIPQDIAPQIYQRNQDVHFEVDLTYLTNQLAIIATNVHRLDFRWSLYQGATFEQQKGGYHYGRETSYTFDRARTYLVVIEAKMPTDTNYTKIDTIQVHIVPYKNYVLPDSSIFIASNDFNINKPVLLESKTFFDPSVKQPQYLWDFGDGILEKGQKVTHSFTKLHLNSLSYIYERAIDDNGLMTDVGFTVGNVNNKLIIVPFGNMSSAPVVTGSITQETTFTNKQRNKEHFLQRGHIIAGVSILILFCIVFLFIVSRKVKK